MTVRVLVVNDEPDVEVLFRQQFTREGHDGHCTIPVDFPKPEQDILAAMSVTRRRG